MSEFECPRCGHQIPNDEMPGRYPGAISRLDNSTEICSVCGLDEAIPGGNGLVKKDQWPVSWTTTTFGLWKASKQAIRTGEVSS